MRSRKTSWKLEIVREYNPAFTIADVKGTVPGVGERCGDDAVLIKKVDSVGDMHKSGVRVAFMFPMEPKRAVTIYDHITGMDEAVLGVTLRAWEGKIHHVLVYDHEKMLECHMKANGWTMDQAVEWSDFNDNAWHGPTTPLVMKRLSSILE